MWRCLALLVTLISLSANAKLADDNWLSAEQEASLRGWKIKVVDHIGREILETGTPLDPEALEWTNGVPQMLDPDLAEFRERIFRFARLWGGRVRLGKLKVTLTPMTKKSYASFMAGRTLDRWEEIPVPAKTLSPNEMRQFFGPELTFCERFLNAWSSFF